MCFGDDRMEGKLGSGHFEWAQSVNARLRSASNPRCSLCRSQDCQVSSNQMKQASGWKRTNQAGPAPEPESAPELEPEPELEPGGSMSHSVRRRSCWLLAALRDVRDFTSGF